GGIADPTGGRRMAVADAGCAMGDAGLPVDQPARRAAVLDRQAQRPGGSTADTRTHPAHPGAVRRLAGYPDRPAAVPAQDPQDQLPGDPVGHHRPAPADLAGPTGAGRALSLAL